MTLLTAMDKSRQENPSIKTQIFEMKHSLRSFQNDFTHGPDSKAKYIQKTELTTRHEAKINNILGLYLVGMKEILAEFG